MSFSLSCLVIVSVSFVSMFQIFSTSLSILSYISNSVDLRVSILYRIRKSFKLSLHIFRTVPLSNVFSCHNLSRASACICEVHIMLYIRYVLIIQLFLKTFSCAGCRVLFCFAFQSTVSNN